MRTLLLVLSVGLLSQPLAAADLTLQVTPQTLANWYLTGADKATLAKNTLLTLPAGAELSRRFADNAVILHLVTQTELSENPAEWPIAGVGSMAIALIKKGNEGHAVLVVDETKAIDLPWTIPLTEKKTTIELILAYDPASGTGLVYFQQQTKLFDVPASTTPTEVWLSAGAKTPWPFDLLQVVLLDPDADQATTKSAAPGSVAKTPKQVAADLLNAAVPSLLARTAPGSASDQADKALKTGPVPTMELFTPAPVRRVQILNTIRKTVAQGQKK